MGQVYNTIPNKATGQNLLATEFNELKNQANSNASEIDGFNIPSIIDNLTPGISITQVGTSISSQSLTTSYSRVALTDTIIYSSPSGVIVSSYDGILDKTTFNTEGVHKLTAVFYVVGTTNNVLYLKSYINGVPVNAGDPVGVNLLGTNKPVAIPFTGFININPGDYFEYYAKMDSSGSFEIVGGNMVWEKTIYKI
jgi:hypothetical protein